MAVAIHSSRDITQPPGSEIASSSVSLSGLVEILHTFTMLTRSVYCNSTVSLSTVYK
jgi:hypothetical protein